MPHMLSQNYIMAKPIEMCAGLCNNNNYYYFVPGTRLNPVVVVSGCPLVKYSEEENPITLLVLVSAFNTLETLCFGDEPPLHVGIN